MGFKESNRIYGVAYPVEEPAKGPIPSVYIVWYTLSIRNYSAFLYVA
jgi:hypothetical protein